MSIRKLYFLLFVQAIILTGFGQNEYVSKIDSLENLINQKTGTEKFDLIVVLMRTHLSQNPKTSLELSRQAESLAFSIGDSLRIVKAKYARGFIYGRLDSVTQSIRVLEDALPIAKRNNYNEQLSKILNSIAIGYSFCGNPDKSIALHFQSIELNERLGNKEDISITYNNIGLLYFKLSDIENALRYYQKSLDIKIAISNDYDLDRLLINMALCYNQLRRYKEGEEFLKRGLQVCKNDCNTELLMQAEIGMGVASYQQGRIEEAIHHFESSLLIARQRNDKKFQIENLLNLANVNVTRGHLNVALSILGEAEKIAKDGGYSTLLVDIYRLTASIYSTKDNYDNASIYQSRYIRLKDSIYTSDLIKNLSKAQTNITDRESIKTLNSKDETLGSKLELIKGQRIQFILVLAIILLSLSLSILLFRVNRKQAQAIDVISNASNKHKI
jgi:tetratricopeptide (TPR) repeat protein